MVAPRRQAVSLAQLASVHRRLVDRSIVVDPAEVPAVMDLGTAVLLHGMLERELESLLQPLLDHTVTAQLQREHDAFAEDLELLNSLWHQEPDSPDLGPLSVAVLARLTAHLARDQRLMYDALNRRPTRDAHTPVADGS